MNKRTELKTFLTTAARAHPWGEMMLDWAPRRTTFWDSRERVVPRRLRKEIELWRQKDAGEGAAVYESYEGGDVLDIGSFHGLYPLILAPKARAGSTFLCFEPDPGAMARLQYNLGIASSLFPGLRFSALPWVVGDGSTAQAYFPMGEGNHPRFSSSQTGSNGARSLCADDCVKLFAMRPSLVKIDVEGAELSVLRGLQSTLSDYRPTVMLELHPKWQPPGSSVQAVVDMLRDHAYTSTNISADDLAVRQLWHPQR